MPKRKSEQSDKKTARKIRRMEKKLKKYRDKLQQPEDCSQDSIVNIENIDIEENNDNIIDPEPDQELIEDSGELTQDFLEALGDPSETEKKYSGPVNPNILQRFEKILVEGLRAEDREKILKELSFPENGKLMEAPRLNIELSGVLTSTIKSRDKMLEERQEDTGYIIATLCQTIDRLTKPNFEVLSIVKSLSDSTRILCNLHYKYTEIRRKMIGPLLDKNIDLNLKDNKRSEWLYSKLDDAVKSASVIKKASTVLAPKKSKNWQPPPRQSTHYHRGRGSARGGYQHLQNQSRYQTRPPPRQSQYQVRRPALAPLSSRGMTRGR